MTYYLVLFTAGLAGSFHCVGMCGGFACALGGDPRGRSATTLRHLLYNTGRLTTYCFLGGLAGGLGQVICTSQGSRAGLALPLADVSLDAAQRGLAVVAGLLMITMALQFFGLRGFHRVAAGFGGSTLAISLRSLLATPGPAAPLAFGVFNGFLPCPLVYALVAQAASTGGALPGFLTMASFGLGTFPAMLAMGGMGRLLGPAWRRRGVWLAGSFILALGLVTLGRGIVPMAAHVGHGWAVRHLA
jgi:sulfite exporter TauE/SafE